MRESVKREEMKRWDWRVMIVRSSGVQEEKYQLGKIYNTNGKNKGICLRLGRKLWDELSESSALMELGDNDNSTGLRTCPQKPQGSTFTSCLGSKDFLGAKLMGA